MTARHKEGYILVKDPTHSNARRDGYVSEHVIIASKALGNPLPEKAVVHHIDGVKDNNINSNLVICENNVYHQLLHQRMRVLKAGGNPNTDKICSECSKVKSVLEYAVSKKRYDGRQNTCKACRKELYH